MRAGLAALALASVLAAQRPPVEEAWDLLAKGARGEAVRLLQDIVRKNPRDADARLLLGSILTETGDRTGAITNLSEAVRLRPRSAEAQNALGEAHKTFADPGAAREAFEKAVALDPNLAPAQENLGLALLQAGDFDAATGHLDRAIQLFGRSADAAFPHYLRAKVYSEHGEAGKAAEQLTQAVTLRPDFSEAWSDLGQARKILLDDAGALAAFERAVTLSPEDSVAQYRLGAQYLQQGRAHVAVEHLRKALQLNPESQSTLYSLQVALREDGQPDEAGRVKRQLAELLRRRDKATEKALRAVQFNNQGAALEKAGNLRGALEKYRAALDLDPEHVGIRVNLAAVLLRLGQLSEGIAELREAVRREPRNAVYRKALEEAEAHAPPGLQDGQRRPAATSPPAKQNGTIPPG